MGIVFYSLGGIFILLEGLIIDGNVLVSMLFVIFNTDNFTDL